MVFANMLVIMFRMAMVVRMRIIPESGMSVTIMAMATETAVLMNMMVVVLMNMMVVAMSMMFMAVNTTVATVEVRVVAGMVGFRVFGPSQSVGEHDDAQYE